jgi:hypothetical protein
MRLEFQQSFQIFDELNRFFDSKLNFISLRLIKNISIKIIDFWSKKN